MTASKVLFYCSLSFIVGVAVDFVAPVQGSVSIIIMALGVACTAASFFIKKEAVVVGFCLLFLLLGALRLQISEAIIANDPVSRLNDKPEKITLVGQIVGEPDIRETSQKITVKVANTQSLVLMTVGRYPEYHYLDTIKATGKLQTPTVDEDFNYKTYLAKDGVYSVMGYPKTELVSKMNQFTWSTWIYEKLLAFKTSLNHSISMVFAPPESFIVKGVILGGTTTMPADLKAAFSATGLTHLTAISGSNVVILSNILMAFLLFLGFWRGQAFYGSVAFIWLYIIIAGFPSSGIRAAIMATVFLLAQKLGRQNISARVIVITAAVMLLQNPMLLPYDVGFQLSFLASLGIIYAKPLFDQAFSFVQAENIRYLLGILSVTLAAQLFTLPVIAYYFNNISLVAPITNILVIPVIDIIMIFGFLGALAGMVSGILGFIVSLPAWVLLKYFLGVMAVFYQPWSMLTTEGIWWVWLVVYYAVVFMGLKVFNTWQLSRKLY